MKNILITIISVLLTALIIICMVKGITIGKFQVLSIPEIKTASLKLDSEIENLNNLKNVTYKKKLSDLESSIKNLTTAKQKYLDLASISTDTEIQQANQEQIYTMEFLWDKVGAYATKNGITLTWNVVSTGVSSKYNLNFTVTGSYIGIINYIYALENDAELAFRIENFKISSAGTNDVTATFTTSNIAIKEESITTATSINNNVASQNEDKNSKNTTENTTNNNTNKEENNQTTD